MDGPGVTVETRRTGPACPWTPKRPGGTLGGLAGKFGKGEGGEDGGEMLEAVEMAACPECGGTFEPRHRLHQYDTDYCRRCAGRRRHGLPQWTPRRRTPKLLGTCRWCHHGIWSDDGHTEPRDYCDLTCSAAAKAARADAVSMAVFMERISHPQPPAPNREYRVIDGFVAEVVWCGSMKRSLAE